jgi:hypothetical protein
MRNFENCDTQDLEIDFGLSRDFNAPLLNDWLDATTTFDDVTKQRLDKLSRRYFEFVDYWNADELKMQGISPMLDIVDYVSDAYTIFSQCPLSAKINGIELGGRVDFMLAKGKQKPIQPYFFIHEYKQETKRGSGDPKGQLLAELLAAQHRNEAKMPMYGCYVIGRNWFFMTLTGTQYAVSNAFNASDNDIFQIIAILRQIKVIIQKQLS